MNRQKSNLFSMGIAVALLGIAAIVLQPQHMEGEGTVSMLDVGQGDSFLIQSANGAQVLIDGGRDSHVLSELAKVMPRGDRSIDVVIATHPDADHIGGLPLVLNRYKVGLFLTSNVTTDTQTFADLYTTLASKKIPSYYVRRGMTLNLDPQTNSSFSILFPDRDTSTWETNSASVIGRLDMGDSSALFTGDSPLSVEHYLATTNPLDLDVDMLKLGHHGSKTSSGIEYLKATSPSLALISAGINNRYGHPHQEVLDRLQALGVPVVSTQESSTVTFETHGDSWSIKK